MSSKDNREVKTIYLAINKLEVDGIITSYPEVADILHNTEGASAMRMDKLVATIKEQLNGQSKS